MDYSGKVKKSSGKRQKLHLELYAKGRHFTALKAVHFLNDWEQHLSHTLDHSHDFYELVVVLHGRGTNCLKSASHSFRPGDVFLIRPGEVHKYEYSEPLTLMTFMFDARILRPLRKDLTALPGCQELFSRSAVKTVLRISPEAIAELDILLNNITMESHSQEPGCSLLLSALLIKVLVIISRSSQKYQLQLPLSSDIGSVISYMLRNFQKEMKLPQLAAMANLSESTFYRQFVQEFGMPPMRWLLELRIRKAREFLIRTDMSINAIARNTGFSDPFYFSRQFSKLTGSTPKRYRSDNHGPLHIIRGTNITRENIS